ncbi:hypothetical protein [Streptomyces sp. 184]|uniref:hypothetical protein n=1 Tax=Streptomyces sp. 184 TaxID=1827526 RepID=UPI003891698F
MGTNYYVQTPACENACEHCGQTERIHLGKSSIGWRFHFQAYPDWPRGDAFNRWLQLAISGPISDEYGKTVVLPDLLSLIYNKSEHRSHSDLDDPGQRQWRAEDRFISSGHDFAIYEFS